MSAFERGEHLGFGIGLTALAVFANKLARSKEDFGRKEATGEFLIGVVIPVGFGLAGAAATLSAIEGLEYRRASGNNVTLLNVPSPNTRKATVYERLAWAAAGGLIMWAGKEVGDHYPVRQDVASVGLVVPEILQVIGGSIILDQVLGGFRVLNQ